MISKPREKKTTNTHPKKKSELIDSQRMMFIFYRIAAKVQKLRTYRKVLYAVIHVSTPYFRTSTMYSTTLCASTDSWLSESQRNCIQNKVWRVNTRKNVLFQYLQLRTEITKINCVFYNPFSPLITRDRGSILIWTSTHNKLFIEQ